MARARVKFRTGLGLGIIEIKTYFCFIMYLYFSPFFYPNVSGVASVAFQNTERGIVLFFFLAELSNILDFYYIFDLTLIIFMSTWEL